MTQHVVAFSKLRYVYPDGSVALSDISLRITHGECVAVIGANGAGKSTLLQQLNGSLSPTSGEVRVGDLTLNKATLPQIRRTVGMIFQDPDSQLFMPTVFDDVAFGPLNLGLPPADAELRAQRALEQVDAWHLRDKPPYLLSGGEKKRVAIATVLSMDPAVLAMDEPSSGLDAFARRQLIALIKGFRHTRIIATHDMDLVVDACERSIVLHEGRVVADGPSREIFRDDALLAGCRLEKPLSLQGCPVCRVPLTLLPSDRA